MSNCPSWTGVPFIDKWIEYDLSRKRQKRHTTKRVLKWLRAEHVFPGGYSPKKTRIVNMGAAIKTCFIYANALCHAQAEFSNYEEPLILPKSYTFNSNRL